MGATRNQREVISQSMNLIYLYDEFMRVPDHLEGQAVYIIDPEIQEGYEISEKVLCIDIN